MKCPVCNKEFKNNNAYAQHIKIHKEFIENQYNIIIDEYVKYGYITSKIMENKDIKIGYGFIKKAIEEKQHLLNL